MSESSLPSLCSSRASLSPIPFSAFSQPHPIPNEFQYLPSTFIAEKPSRIYSPAPSVSDHLKESTWKKLVSWVPSLRVKKKKHDRHRLRRVSTFVKSLSKNKTGVQVVEPRTFAYQQTPEPVSDSVQKAQKVQSVLPKRAEFPIPPYADPRFNPNNVFLKSLYRDPSESSEFKSRNKSIYAIDQLLENYEGVQGALIYYLNNSEASLSRLEKMSPIG